MDPEAVRKTVELFADFLSEYFVALAAVGAFAMALIEFWKKLRDSRTRFHARQVTEWLYGWPPQQTTDKCVPSTQDRIDAYAELLHLTTATPFANAQKTCELLRAKKGRVPSAGWVPWTPRQPEYSLFGLDLETMLGHVQTAAETAVSYPQRYPRLYQFMTDGADGNDVRAWAEMANAPRVDPSVEASKQRAELHARLHTLTKRRIDAVQLFVGQMWANRNQRQANVVGAAVMFAALWWTNAHPSGQTEAQPLSGDEMVVLVVLALLGGILSPIAKDLVTALKRVRETA